MIARNHRQATLPCLTCLALGMTMMAGVQLVAAPADRPPLRGLEEVDHAQVENLKTEDRGQKTAIRAPSSVLRYPGEDGHVTKFDKVAGVFDGSLQGHHVFDCDLHKALEGAVHSLQHCDDSRLRQRVEAFSIGSWPRNKRTDSMS